MRLFRRAALTLLATLAIAFAGASPVAASTSLHQTTPITAASFTHEGCGDTVVAEGTALWHFVLTQTQANEAMLTASFGYPLFDVAVLSSKNSGGVLHFNVTTSSDAVLLGAVTTADGGLLNLSHTCINEEVQPSTEPTPTPTPSVSPTPTPTPTDSPEPSATPSPSPSPQPSDSPSPSPSGSASTPPSESPTPSSGPGLTPPPTDTAGGDPEPSSERGTVQALLATIGGVTLLYLLAHKAPESRRANRHRDW